MKSNKPNSTENKLDKLLAKAKAPTVVKSTNKEIRQNSTKSEDKKVPTSSMRKWLAAAIELGFSASISEIAEKSGVDRTTWYVWIENSEFVEWWDSAWNKHIKLMRHKLDLIGLKQAEKDHAWWKDMMNRTGNTIVDATPIPAGNLQQNNNIVLPPELAQRLLKD